MRNIINEKVVIEFYLSEMDKNNIQFLKNNKTSEALIRQALLDLLNDTKMNDKIRHACVLWKALFDAAMSFINPNKEGYDRLFNFFDSYVEFEELIFASDSFYRDHTLHCIWVYLLGEYIKRNEGFKDFCTTGDFGSNGIMLNSLKKLIKNIGCENHPNFKEVKVFYEVINKTSNYSDSMRCISSLTHDLGYPLKKVDKINKSIKGILPYFAINNFNDFSFEYSSMQQNFLQLFITFLSNTVTIGMSTTDEKALNILLDILWDKSEANRYGEISENKINNLTENEIKLLKEHIKLPAHIEKRPDREITFYNDFEQYKHGIMSAFLLVKNLKAFQNLKCDNFDFDETYGMGELVKYFCIHNILMPIVLHTNDSYKMNAIEETNYLLLIDELEEFSRISRASQSREYVEQFCNTRIYMENGIFTVDFEFDNDSLENLKPELSFKGKCKRFLSMFDIKNLDPYLKLRVNFISKLKNDNNVYTLIIERKNADILINGASQNIPEYLKSNQFYTKEQYAEI